MFTGGGRVLLEQQLREMVAPTRSEGQYLFVDPKLAPVLNAIGGYVLAQAAAKKILARRQSSTFFECVPLVYRGRPR